MLLQNTHIWPKINLLDISDVKTGKVDANHASAFGKYKFFTCALEPLAADTFSFEGELIILPGNGANVGQVFYYNGKAEAYQRTYVLYNFLCSTKFIYYHLKWRWKIENEKKQYGSATNYIKMGNFTDYDINLPSLHEQKIIAEKLDTLLAQVDSTKARLEQIPQILKRFRQAVLATAMSGKLTNLPTANNFKIKDIACVIGGLTKNSKRNNFEKEYHTFVSQMFMKTS